MFKTFNRWLNHHSYFRYGYFLLLIIIVFLYSFFPNYRNFYLLFIVSVIFLGIGFYNKPTWVIFLLTVITGVFKIFLLPEQISDVSTLLIQLSSYLIIAFISVGLRKNVQIVHEDQIELVTALSKALDTRDSYTLHHSENAAKYAIEIAEKMKLPKDLCNSIRIGGLLHDIGKIGIPENILNKSGDLTDEEYQIIKTHPTVGYEIIKHVTSFNKDRVLDIVLYHHEKFDGTGYPLGLKGDQIPLVARIVGVADSFDAMTTNRVYRNNLSLDIALDEIRKNKGSQFDPEIVDVFLSLFESGKNSKSKNFYSKTDALNF